MTHCTTNGAPRSLGVVAVGVLLVAGACQSGGAGDDTSEGSDATSSSEDTTGSESATSEGESSEGESSEGESTEGETGAPFTIDPTVRVDPLFEWEAGATQNATLAGTSAPTPAPDYKFRMGVAISHDSYDDPIVHPHREGRAHHHLFLGNAHVDAHSTNAPGATHDHALNHDPAPIENMSGQGVNRSGYWVPVMYDHGPDGEVGTMAAQADDQPMVMGFNQIYYLKSPRGDTSFDAAWESELQAMPPGLQIITSPASYVFNCAYEPYDPSDPLVYFEPSNAGAGNNWPGGFWPPGEGAAIPQCDTTVANNVTMRITFPDCWDGVNLTDADDDDDPSTESPGSRHDHMAYSDNNTGCPASHPVQLGTVQYNFYFPIRDPSYDSSEFYLASDVSMSDGYSITCPPGEHGCSNHGDWMNGWELSAMQKMVNTTDGCLGSITAHCAAGEITSTERLAQPAGGTPNWRFGHESFQYEFQYSRPILLDPPATTANFNFSGTDVPDAREVTWEAMAVCEGEDGADFTQTFTHAEIEAALIDATGWPDTFGTYDFDWLALGTAGGKAAHTSLNAEVPCTGFCFQPTVTADGVTVVGDCD